MNDNGHQAHDMVLACRFCGLYYAAWAHLHCTFRAERLVWPHLKLMMADFIVVDVSNFVLPRDWLNIRVEPGKIIMTGE